MTSWANVEDHLAMTLSDLFGDFNAKKINTTGSLNH